MCTAGIAEFIHVPIEAKKQKEYASMTRLLQSAHPRDHQRSAHMVKLIDYGDKPLAHGTVFRCTKAEWPYENSVDYLLCDLPAGLGFVVCSGYKAGLVYCIFPSEAYAPDTLMLNPKWIRDHWKEWGYDVCPLEDVYIGEIASMELIGPR